MSNADAVADLVAFGASPEVIAQLEEASPAEDFAVFPENWPTVQLFMLLQTQWKYAGNGVAVGLDYTGVDVVMRRRQIDDPDGELFAGLQEMEFAALEAVRD